MTPQTRRARLVLTAVTMALAGCARTASERRGEFHKAYDHYCEQLKTGPSNTSPAAAGIRRTAPHAAAYWQRRAYAAAEAGDWGNAATYHRKVLEIKPNELSSILSLRQIARTRGDQVLLASRTPPAKPKPAAAKPRPKPIPQTPKQPKPKPKPKPAAAETRSYATTRPAERPRVATVNPYRQKPTVSHRPGAAKGEFVMVVCVSREDSRYAKTARLRDGLVVKVKDTDKRPLDADVNIYLRTKRIAKLSDLPEDSVIAVIGQSRHRYEIVVMNIYDATETVTIGLRRPK